MHKKEINGTSNVFDNLLPSYLQNHTHFNMIKSAQVNLTKNNQQKEKSVRCRKNQTLKIAFCVEYNFMALHLTKLLTFETKP